MCLRWEHACSLDTLTLSILLKHQGSSIHTLNFRKCTGNWRKADLAKFTIPGLTTLGITELGRGCPWATELLARNYQNLRHLRLGSEMDLASEYAYDGYVDLDEVRRFTQTETFAELTKEKVAALNEPSTPVVRLESLWLIGIDLLAFAGALIEPNIDFNSLSMLTLESCVGLKAAFPLLMGSGAGKRKAKSALRLHTLAIRHENASNGSLQELETFLLSLKPLTHLHVLLEGKYDWVVRLHKILRLHGRCLRSLIWDERTGPRSNMHEHTTIFPDDYENLKLVAEHCPGLKALGISLDWEDIAGSEENHKKVNTVAALGCALIFMLIVA